MPKKQPMADDPAALPKNAENLVGEVFDVSSADLINDKALLRKIDLRLMPLLYVVPDGSSRNRR